MSAGTKAWIARLTPYGSLTGWSRGLFIALVAGLFLAWSGAFGMDRLPLGGRLAYWLPLMVLGSVWGGVAARLAFGAEPDGSRLWLRTLLAGLVIAGPFTGVVWIATTLALGVRFSALGLVSLFSSVLAISLVMTAINVLAASRRTADPIAPPPRFLERLPLKLRGAEIWAVEAEDHYLRLHTSKGQDLILMRLSDAVAELEGIEGAQVHRSWWVAREAIVDAARGDGRAVLTLKDGSQVPVSRTYAKMLREKRWI
ncbi:MAG: LytTR family DNA-binding domain-containing protein [Phenylobacterium sp.]|uniref:LytTR family DNA-binding domain-containing protein n=1 Tax=Phenylobacterium sp. TaxID=1871053 RepID=UPI003918B0ED